MKGNRCWIKCWIGLTRDYVNNLGQNITDKFSKLSKNRCSCEMF